MTTPKFIAGRATAIVLGAMQIGYAFMANDWLAVGIGRVGLTPIAGAAGLIAVITAVLAWNMAGVLQDRGQSRLWAAMAVASLSGVAVVYSLPDRAFEQRGFPIKPNQP